MPVALLLRGEIDNQGGRCFVGCPRCGEILTLGGQGRQALAAPVGQLLVLAVGPTLQQRETPLLQFGLVASSAHQLHGEFVQHQSHHFATVGRSTLGERRRLDQQIRQRLILLRALVMFAE